MSSGKMTVAAGDAQRSRHRDHAGTASGRAAILSLAAGSLSGTAGTAVIWLAPTAPPLSAGTMRLLVGGMCLTLIATACGHRLTALRGHLGWLLPGAVAVAAYQLCLFTGVTRTGVALATVIAMGSAPVFSGLINALLLKRPPSLTWLIGTAMAITGVSLITRGQPTAQTDLLGIIAAAGAGLAWAAYALISHQRIARGLDSTTCMAAMFLTGAVLSLPVLALGDTSWLVTPRGISGSTWESSPSPSCTRGTASDYAI